MRHAIHSELPDEDIGDVDEEKVNEGDGLVANQLVEETGLAEEKENELIVKSSHGSDYSDESLSNPVSALVLAGPVSSQV